MGDDGFQLGLQAFEYSDARENGSQRYCDPACQHGVLHSRDATAVGEKAPYPTNCSVHLPIPQEKPRYRDARRDGLIKYELCNKGNTRNIYINKNAIILWLKY
jgi:hypothetical protein